jgi:hypothetical protein
MSISPAPELDERRDFGDSIESIRIMSRVLSDQGGENWRQGDILGSGYFRRTDAVVVLCDSSACADGWQISWHEHKQFETF